MHSPSLCSNTSENSCCGLTAPSSGAICQDARRPVGTEGVQGLAAGDLGHGGPSPSSSHNLISVHPAPSLKEHGSHGVTLHACSRALASFCPWTAGARGRACRRYSVQGGPLPGAAGPFLSPGQSVCLGGLAALAPPGEVTAPSRCHCGGRLSPSHSADRRLCFGPRLCSLCLLWPRPSCAPDTRALSFCSRSGQGGSAQGPAFAGASQVSGASVPPAPQVECHPPPLSPFQSHFYTFLTALTVL